MRQRRGMALLAALWLVVAIAAVALQFSIEAHERRTIGILASERGIQRAAALGALAMLQARLDQALRVAPSGNNPTINRLRASDPWLDADSIYSGTVMVDSLPVRVEAHDLGEKLNINQLSEQELQTFFSFLLGDFPKSTQLAQSIMDWRDPDSIPRPSGAERDAYIKAEHLALPTNAPFLEIEDLKDVMYMTPEIYAKASKYLTTKGFGVVNLNTAPVPVLRVLPGMTDALINKILQMRSQGQRIASVGDVVAPTRNGQRPTPGQINTAQAQQALSARASVDTRMIELTITARVGPQAPATRLTAIMQKQGTNGVHVMLKEW
jgi:general secretion pathway protein K